MHPNIRQAIDPFIPRFNELSLYMVAFTFLSIFAFSSPFRSIFIASTQHLSYQEFKENPFHFILFVLISLALLFSILAIIHALIRSHISYAEKYFLVNFAATVYGLVGFAAGYWEYVSGLDWKVIFPIWNMIHGGYYLFLLRFNLFKPVHVEDGDAEKTHLLYASGILLLVILLCLYAFKLDFLMTFSISLGTASTLDGLFKSKPVEQKVDTLVED